MVSSGYNNQLVTVFLDCYLYFRHSTFFGYTQEHLPSLINTVDKWKSLVSFPLLIHSQLNWTHFPPLSREEGPHKDFKQFHWSTVRLNPGYLLLMPVTWKNFLPSKAGFLQIALCGISPSGLLKS